jgi:hypothetical protein
MVAIADLVDDDQAVAEDLLQLGVELPGLVRPGGALRTFVTS